MERLDDFIKGKLEQREFEFSQAHWKQAAQMIDAQEKKRRKAFWLWLFIGQFLILGVAFALWQPKNEPTVDFVEQKQVVTTEQKPSLGTEISKQNLDPQTREKEIYDDKKNHTISKKADSDNSISFDQENYTVIEGGESESKKYPKNNSAPSKISTLGLNTSVQPTIANTENLHIEERTHTQNKPLLSEQAKINETPVMEGSVIEKLTIKNFWVKSRLEKKWKGKIDLNIQNSTDKTALRFFAASTLYPYTTSEGKNFIGYSAGINYARRLKKSWGFETGFHYRLRQGTFSKSQTTEKTTYAFSRSVEQFFTLPEQIHSLEIPLSLTFSKHRHNFALGLNYSYLLGVKGSLNRQGRGEAFPDDPGVEVIEKGWMKSTAFKQNHFDLSGAYFFRVNAKMSIGAKVYYTLGSILKDQNTTNLYVESKPFFFDIGLRYNLLNR